MKTKKRNYHVYHWSVPDKIWDKLLLLSSESEKPISQVLRDLVDSVYRPVRGDAVTPKSGGRDA